MTNRKTNQKTKAKMLLMMPVAAVMFILISCMNGQNNPKVAETKKDTSNSIITNPVVVEVQPSTPLKDSIPKKHPKVFAVSPIKMNVLYLGADNPISISVSEVPPEDLNVSITNGTIRNAHILNGKIQMDGEYIVNPKVVGNAIISLSNGNEKIGMMEFRVKYVPDPVAKVAGRKSGDITKNELLKQRIVQVDMEGFDFDIPFKVKEFKITTSNKGLLTDISSKSNEINEEQKALLSKLNSGDRVFFQDIKAVGPDGRIREMNSVNFRIY